MPRTARIDIAGGIYHVITRGIERRTIFRDETDRKEFLSRLSEDLTATKSQCYGWVLMPNHLHLVIRRGINPLSTLMRRVLTGYAMYFNARHRRCGHLYQNRYKSILCQEETYLLELIRYVHLNPLRAKLVNTFEELNRYRWSGHSVLMGNHKTEWQETGEILNRFGTRRQEAIDRYANFIREGLHRGHSDKFSGGGLRRSAGGWSGVWELKRNNERWASDERILGDGDFVGRVLKEADVSEDHRMRMRREGWNFERIVERVCELLVVDPRDIKKRSRGTKLSDARSLVAYWGQSELGLRVSTIAEYFDIASPSASALIKRGEQLARENKLKLLN